jgi:signal peptidase
MKKIIAGILLFFLVIFVGGFIITSANNPFKIRNLVVLSGSMEPAIKTGSIIFIRPKNNYQIGDVVSFYSGKQIFTHRVKEILSEQNTKQYLTKGDANGSSDTRPINHPDVLGSVIVTLPFIGYLMSFSRSIAGLILFIFLPAAIIIALELINIVKEIKKINSGHRQVNIEWQKIITVLIIGISILLFFTNRQVALAYFSSLFIFSGNTITTGNITSPVTPTPTVVPTLTIIPTVTSTPTLHIVINEVYYDVGTKQFEGVVEDEPNNEWIELYNPTDTAKSIKGWKITDNSGTKRVVTNSDISIGPKCFAIISKVINTFNYWTIPSKCSNGENVLTLAIDTAIGEGLANTGDRVILIDDNGTEVDKISYGTDTTVYNPSAEDVASGHSLERDPDGQNNNLGSDFIDRSIPKPGE